MGTYIPTKYNGSIDLHGLGKEDVVNICDKRYVNETGDTAKYLIVINDLVVGKDLKVENDLLVGNQLIVKECTITSFLKVTDVIITGKASCLQKPDNPKHIVNKGWVDNEIKSLNNKIGNAISRLNGLEIIVANLEKRVNAQDSHIELLKSNMIKKMEWWFLSNPDLKRVKEDLIKNITNHIEKVHVQDHLKKYFDNFKEKMETVLNTKIAHLEQIRKEVVLLLEPITSIGADKALDDRLNRMIDKKLNERLSKKLDR